MDLKAEQGQALEQLVKRFNYIWRKADATTRSLMIASETKFPLNKGQILSIITIEGSSYLDYKNALDRAVDSMILLRQEYPDCWIGPVKNTFVIYSKPLQVESLIF